MEREKVSKLREKVERENGERRSMRKWKAEIINEDMWRKWIDNVEQESG